MDMQGDDKTLSKKLMEAALAVFGKSNVVESIRLQAIVENFRSLSKQRMQPVVNMIEPSLPDPFIRAGINATTMNPDFGEEVVAELKELETDIRYFDLKEIILGPEQILEQRI
ncbi:hypothetical protein SARC_10164 [Sphaeroforma arctica JP610]|uniref:Uncharacterized protein n=1 Tax=Sphaeroforma arctica JP610 TaxID=667725 RepID=A0A0L0FKQ9_9EUKA|nr:hypothetical protein SARC_10164 [Sphaeroforma arctica JP610]KNC77372.1 hypothetical protein SARC_10164 [Sphaeroforma arctica JP610]|eukprot:XP_014151274.1 hypothetical protein SARC_10164 [Sphaeroforma arctica JP610]